MTLKSVTARLPLPWRKAPADAAAPSGALTKSEERLYFASQSQLMWWRFRKHKLAVVSAIVVLMFYTVGLFAEFVAPYDPDANEATRAYRPPSKIHLRDADGKFHLRPFVYGVTQKRDLETLSLVFTEDKSKIYPIYMFVHGSEHTTLGFITTDLHLFGLKDPNEVLLLLGADHRGRDEFSRVIYGARISLSVGLIGVMMSFVLGVLIGGLSGYLGGTVDTIIQRGIEFLRSIPTIPLWMGLSAAMPANWPVMRVYFGITIILSLLGWTGLARVVRGRFLALRTEDYILAARLDGCKTFAIIRRHMVPAFASHIIAALTLAVPAMILGETALSFLGLGLRYPAISWGVLLQDAQNMRSVALAPWMLSPGIAVVLAVLSMNFLGDGLRDAADPYSH